MAVFSNRATLTYSGGTTDSNIAYGEILDVLTATKTAVEATYAPDGAVTYVLTLRNTGATALTGLTINDDLGGYTGPAGTVYPLTLAGTSIRLFVNGTLQPAPTVAVGPPLTVSGVNIPAGGDAVLVYRALVNDFADPTGAGTLTNTATVTGGGLTAPITATETLAAATGAELTISKSVSPAQVVDNDRVTYTLVVQNTGNLAVDAGDNAAITDTLDPILTALAVTYNGAPWTQGVQYNYSEATGQFSTVPGQLLVPAATYTQDVTTGAYTVSPGIATITITGTI